MDKKNQGVVGQLRVAHQYQLFGYNIFFPFGDTQKYDLVIEKEGIFKKVQVKTTLAKEGYIYVDARVIGHNLKGVKVYQPNATDFDILAVVEMKSQNVYAIPYDGSQRQFTLRTAIAKNNQQKNVRLASDYILGP